MNLEHVVADIESCETTNELKNTLQKVIEEYGFQSFNLLDAGNPHEDVPFYIGTTPQSWVEEYKMGGFVHVDPCVSLVRRTNVPFIWEDVPTPSYEGAGRKPRSLAVMEAAADHGFTEGFVVPFHYRDHMGRLHSSSSAFYWTDSIQKFRFLMSRSRYDLHLIMLYWAQRIADIVAEQYRGQSTLTQSQQDPVGAIVLTDRERDVLSWAARGKTVADTADILSISGSTTETHIRNALLKLDATNKTHGVAKAMYLGLIDV